jgi:hypothetical protein
MTTLAQEPSHPCPRGVALVLLGSTGRELVRRESEADTDFLISGEKMLLPEIDRSISYV